jgi:hypothetical protein
VGEWVSLGLRREGGRGERGGEALRRPRSEVSGERQRRGNYVEALRSFEGQMGSP